MKREAWVHIDFFEGSVRCDRCGEFSQGRYAEGQSWSAEQQEKGGSGKSPRQRICMGCLATTLVPTLLSMAAPPPPPSQQHPERN